MARKPKWMREQKKKVRKVRTSEGRKRKMERQRQEILGAENRKEEDGA